MEEKPQYRGSIVGPVILIGLGIIFLLQTNGVLHWSVWDVIFRLWPILIVAVGLDILIGRRSILGKLIALVLSLGILMGAVWLMGAGVNIAGGELGKSSILFPRGDFKDADLSITQGSGEMTVHPLSDNTKDYVSASIEDLWVSRVRSNQEVIANHGEFSIWLEGPDMPNTNGNLNNHWDIGLSPKTASNVDLTLGAGSVRADFATALLTALQVKLGAGDIDLWLPSGQNTSVSINVGAGRVVIHLPEGAAVEVHCTTGVGSCTLPKTSGFWSVTYTSENFSQSKTKVIIEINMGVGEAVVE